MARIIDGLARIIDGLVRGMERSLLDEDEEVISGVPGVVDRAKQQLQGLEDYINIASFLLATGVVDNSNPQQIEQPLEQRIDHWISEARKTAFCLADQIAMYGIRGSSDSELYHMKCDIGMLRIGELATRIADHEGQMPDEVKNRENMPFIIGHFRSVPLHKIVSLESMEIKIEEVEAFLKGDCPVLFITGGQGSGKTTLMKDVYTSQEEKMREVDDRGRFNHCCWVDMAETRGLVELLKKVLEQSNVDCDSIDEFKIMETVYDTLKNKHYLIVLDNVKDTYVVYTLKHVLNISGKIICLTRRTDMQKNENQDVIHIPRLKRCDSFNLFLSAAFCNFSSSTVLTSENFNSSVSNDVLREAIESKHQGTPDHDELVKLLNAILSKCQDNPWNICSIGRLLEANPLEKWETIGERVDGMLIDGDKRNEKHDPPVQLEDAKLADAAIRRCFLYCLAFPKTSESGKGTSEILEVSRGIPTKKLIRLWAAEGYVQGSWRQSQEEVAECMLEELIKKNLLVVKKKGFDGAVLKCSVNDHIRPLAEKMCEQQKFCKHVHDDNDEASSSRRMRKCFPISPNRLSRSRKTLSDRYEMLAVHADHGANEVWRTFGKNIRLRSLLYFKTGRMERSELELSFRRRYMLLRTLELQGARLAYLPSSVGCLVCLRYLGLRNTQLEYLPMTLQRLRQLICLDIRDTHIAEVVDVSQFREMRHLYLTNSFRSHSVAIRQGLDSLVHLQTLSGAAYGESSGNTSFEEQIAQLRRLRKLSMKKAPSTSSRSFCDAINKIEPLQSLALSCDRDGQQFDLTALKIGKNLRKLKLGGPICNFFNQDQFKQMQSITFLYLWDSKLPNDRDLLRTLQGLERLLVLSLLNTSMSEGMRCDDGGYKKLKKLSIISMENLSECKFGQNAMGNLEELVFAKCGKLKSLPQGLDHLGSLREVHLTEMLPSFRQEAIDKLGDKVHVLRDALSLVVSSRAATGGGS